MAELESVKAYLLVLVRLSGLLFTAPLFSSRNFPATAKIGLAGLTALIITPLIQAPAEPLPEEAISFAFIGVKELIVGVTMGFVMTLMFSAIQVAGEITDTLTGFSIVNVFNPAMETQVPIFGFFFYVIAVLYLLALNGHHIVFTAFVSSYEKIPLGGFVFHGEALREQVVTWGRVMFYDGLMISAPVAGALFLTYVTMGLMGRVVPQIHLFVVGFPITIAIGLGVAAVSMQMYLGYLEGMFDRMFRGVSAVINGMS